MLFTTPRPKRRVTRRFIVPQAVRTRSAPSALPEPVDHDPPQDSLLPDGFGLPTPSPEPETSALSNYQVQNWFGLVTDRSGSTAGPAAQFVGGINAFATTAKSDLLTPYQVLIADVQFGNGQVKMVPSQPLAEWEPQDLLPREGDTPLGRAISESLAHFRAEKARLRKAGIPLNQSVLMILTDGGATDLKEFEAAKADLHRAEREERLKVFPIALGHYVPEIHRLSCKREAVVMREGKYEEFFSWVADLLARVSRSQPGDEIPLSPIDGWAVIKG